MKITVCAKCGSQDLETPAWVYVQTKQWADDYEPKGNPEYYCNGKCGGHIGNNVRHFEYLEKHGAAYQLWGGTNGPVLSYCPMNVDGSIDIDSDSEVDIGHCIAEEGRQYYEDILALFPAMRNEVILLFKPYIDTVKDFVANAVEDAIENVAKAAHQHFKTKSGDIEPLQQVRLDQLTSDLVDLITAQVKQNL